MQAGETQKEAADRMYVSERTISGWESPNSYRLTTRHMKHLYKAYKTTESQAVMLAEEIQRDSQAVKAAPAFLKGGKPYIDCIVGFNVEGDPVMLLDVLDKLLGGEVVDRGLCNSAVAMLALISEDRL